MALKAARKLRRLPPQATDAPALSPRTVLIEIRREWNGAAPRRQKSYARRLRGCGADARHQKSPKASREWPRRQPHPLPGAAVLHTLTDEQKDLLQHHFDAA